jgi:hypothetical protein
VAALARSPGPVVGNSSYTIPRRSPGPAKWWPRRAPGSGQPVRESRARIGGRAPRASPARALDRFRPRTANTRNHFLNPQLFYRQELLKLGSTLRDPRSSEFYPMIAAATAVIACIAEFNEEPKHAPISTRGRGVRSIQLLGSLSCRILCLSSPGSIGRLGQAPVFPMPTASRCGC